MRSRREIISGFGAFARHHTVAVGLALAAITILAAGVLLSPNLFRSNRGPSVSPIAAATVSPKASPSSTVDTTVVVMPTETPWPTEELPTAAWPSDEPLPTMRAQGWPLWSVDSVIYNGDPFLTAPDGTLFVYDSVIDTRGFRRSGWRLPDGEPAYPSEFGPDGTSYGTYETDAYNTRVEHVWSFDPKGKLLFDIKSDAGLSTGWQLGPGGSVYITTENLSGENAELVATRIVDRQGKLLSQWNWPEGAVYPFVLRDGRLLTEKGSDRSCRLHLFDSSGRDTSENPANLPGCWPHLTQTDDQTLLAWLYDCLIIRGQGYQVLDIRFALLGLDGKPLPGWSIKVDGDSFDPMTTPDGRVVVVEKPGKDRYLHEYSREGVEEPGFPVLLPSGTSYIEAPVPVIGADGTVYVYVSDSANGAIYAYDRTGAQVPGWPYKLQEEPLTFGNMAGDWLHPPLYAPDGQGGGLLIVSLRDRLVALRQDGSVAPGWPFFPGKHFEEWASIGISNGDVLACADYEEGDTYYSLVYRLTPEGKSRK